MLFDEMSDIQMVFVNTKLRPISICTTFYTAFYPFFSKLLSVTSYSIIFYVTHL